MKDLLEHSEPLVAKHASQAMKLAQDKKERPSMAPTERTAKVKESLKLLSIQISNLKEEITKVKSHYKQINNEQKILRAKLM